MWRAAEALAASRAHAISDEQRKIYQDELKRGLWQLPPDQTILKGCGGKAPRPARLVPITAQVSE